MARILIYKSPVVGGLNEEAALAWEDLAQRLRGLGYEVMREDRYMEPGRVGVVWPEVVLIYLAMKAVDAVTDHAMNAVLQPVIDTAKEWARARFAKSDVSRSRPLLISFVGEDGKVVRSWILDKDGEREQPSERSWPPMDLDRDSGADNALTKSVLVGRPDAGVRLLLRYLEGHLNVYAFVGDQLQAAVDITRLPTNFVVTPSMSGPVIFRVDTASSNPDEVEVSAPGWRCEPFAIDSETNVTLCYEEA